MNLKRWRDEKKTGITMINIREEILKALPIPDFITWWYDNWSGFGFHVWADELLEMQKEGVVKIENGGVELVG